MRNGVLFYTKGRGRGHVVRDLAIAAALQRTAPDLEISFASYATGLVAYRDAGKDCLDVGLPEFPSFHESIIAAGKLMRKVDARMVVAQEDLAAVIAAKIFDRRAIFHTHWFHPSTLRNNSAHSAADHTIFTEDAGIFSEPFEVEGKISYVGPIIRELNAEPSKRDEYRRRFGLEGNDFCVLVVPGSFPEDRSQIAYLIWEAFAGITTKGRKIIKWIGKEQPDDERIRAFPIYAVDIVTYESELDAWMVACDVMISKGTYNTVKEAESMGCPNIALSHGINRVDDIYASSAKLCTLLYVEKTSARRLASHIARKYSQRTSGTGRSQEMSRQNAMIAAKIIISYME